jgi:hypothetical protein
VYAFLLLLLRARRTDRLLLHAHTLSLQKKEKQNKTSDGKKQTRRDESENIYYSEREERKDKPTFLHAEYVCVGRCLRRTPYLFAIKSRCNVILLLNVCVYVLLYCMKTTLNFIFGLFFISFSHFFLWSLYCSTTHTHIVIKFFTLSFLLFKIIMLSTLFIPFFFVKYKHVNEVHSITI